MGSPGVLGTFASRLRRAFGRGARFGDCQTPTTAEATLATADAFTHQVLGLLFPRCGDGVLTGGEQCDGADSPACAGLCQVDCTCPPPVCGNGVIESGEDCDGSAPGLCVDVGGNCGAPGAADACVCCGEQVCAPGLSCCGTDSCLMSPFGFGVCLPESCTAPDQCPIPFTDCQDGHCCGPVGATCAIEGFVFGGCCPGLSCVGTPTFSSCATP